MGFGVGVGGSCSGGGGGEWCWWVMAVKSCYVVCLDQNDDLHRFPFHGVRLLPFPPSVISVTQFKTMAHAVPTGSASREVMILG